MIKSIWFRRFTPLLCFFLVLFAGNFTGARAQMPASAPHIPDTAAIRIGVSGSPPFIVQNEDEEGLEGISYEIWKELADGADWKFSTQRYSSVSEGLEALKKGAIDILVGPISITSDRVKTTAFTQPYFQSSLSIMSTSGPHGFWDRIAPFFSIKLLFALGIFLFILAIVGTFVWLAEKKESPEQFPASPIKGIANGMWLAIVTMTTTGYGDMAPVTLWGRVIVGTWMIISIIFAGTMIAGIASTLTLTGIQTNEITNVEQLSGKRTAVIANSPAESFSREHNAVPVEVKNLEEAFEKLSNKEVKAIIYDRPQMMYYLKKHRVDNMTISKAEYYKQGYGFALPMNSVLVRKINVHLLALSEQGDLQRIFEYWLGDENR